MPSLETLEAKAQYALDQWHFFKGQWNGKDPIKWKAATHAWRSLQTAYKQLEAYRSLA